MSLLERLKRRRSVKQTRAEGLAAALEAVERFRGRTFRVNGRGIRAAHVPQDEVARFIDEEFPGYYTYTTKVETYTGRRNVRHAWIEIKGWSGLSRQMNRYNPFDMTCTIRTEPPE